MNQPHYSLAVVTKPPIEPLSLTQARLHLKIDDDLTADVELITDLIVVARELCEAQTGRAFIATTFDMRIDTRIDLGQADVNLGAPPFYNDNSAWAGYAPLIIPRSPLISVDRVQYLDADGATQTLDSALYDVDLYSEPGRLTRAYNAIWPYIRWAMNGMTVRFTAGYPYGSPDTDAAANVPARVRAAMKLIIGHLYENRENVVVGMRAVAVELPQGAKDLLFPLKVELF